MCAVMFLMSKDEQLGHGSHVCCGQMVVVFPRYQPIQAQRSAYHLGTAGGCGKVQLAGWGGWGRVA